MIWRTGEVIVKGNRNFGPKSHYVDWVNNTRQRVVAVTQGMFDIE